MECYDVIIVGSGVSGLYSALNLNNNLKMNIMCKGDIRESNSYLAQGGISTAKDKDDVKDFIEDTLKAGNYKNNRDTVKILCEESIENIESIINLGLELDKFNGLLSYTREGAHRKNRIVHHKDFTGKALVETLITEINKRKNIIVNENCILLDIVVKENKCIGIVVLQNGKTKIIYSKAVILATGGIGGLFNKSTNQRILTGDGLAIAVKNHIQLKDLNYIQIHPTALYSSVKEDRSFLISESLRGEGAVLINVRGERFVDELLPRDKVSYAINQEMIKTNSDFVYLNITHLNKEYIISRFPGIYNYCINKGIDITKEYIPVCPAQHYFMGGIKVDSYGKTSMKNLYAIGETACTGVHGSNRLASNSLLEALVFSKRCANYINLNINNSIIETLERNVGLCLYSEKTLLENKNRILGIFLRSGINSKKGLIKYAE